MSEDTSARLATSPAVDVAERSDPGRDPTKQVNEDACGYRDTPFGILAVVCDGMGGHVGGREASTAAMATIFEAFEKAAPGSSPRDVLRDSLRLANTRVRTLVIRESGGHEAGGRGGAGGEASGSEAPPGRPGSTVVAVLVHAMGTEIAHVGDSRVFLVQQGQVLQLTRDHSMVQEMVAAKILTPDQAAIHPDANKITRALGIDDDVEVEVRPQAIAHVAGDAFVLCTDGLSDLVDPSEILQIVSSDPPAQAAGRLVDLANARGGYDNITVMILRPRVSAPPIVHGALPPTRVSTTVTLRPPAAPPFAVIPVAPPPPSAAPSARGGKPHGKPNAEPSLAARLGIAPGIAVGLGLGVACVAAAVLFHLAGRGTGRRREPLDAGAPLVQLGLAPSASVELAPADLPPPSVVDAAGVAPMEPALPSPPGRHPHGKPLK